MKGIVFTEFLEMVESEYGLEIVDSIIDESKIKSKGIYTSIGTYDFSEMQSLLTLLSKKAGKPIDELIFDFGKYFFGYIEKKHADIISLYDNAFDFATSIESHIHVHVRKIYADSELPTFTNILKEENRIQLLYESERGMYMFAKALFEMSFKYFKKNVIVDYQKLNESGNKVKFTITEINEWQ